MDLVNNLPEELLLNIFEFMEFDELQKSIVLVCKSWFFLIRRSTKLSKAITIVTARTVKKYPLSRCHEVKLCKLNPLYLPLLLQRWPKLSSLHMFGAQALNLQRIDFKVIPIF